ncbi:MAG: hypothetical protein L0346_34380 [Chloroflexi bacterium]|nr:hypothetical protein [Chloroflexota bacterium]
MKVEIGDVVTWHMLPVGEGARWRGRVTAIERNLVDALVLEGDRPADVALPVTFPTVLITAVERGKTV